MPVQLAVSYKAKPPTELSSLQSDADSEPVKQYAAVKHNGCRVQFGDCDMGADF